jgi:septum formation topological specificity factor MinE
MLRLTNSGAARNVTQCAETNPDDVDLQVGPPAPKRDRTYFAAQVCLRWNKARESILEVGHLLVEAKRTLSPDEYQAFTADDVPFDYSTLQKLCYLSENARINDPRNQDRLPHSWNTLYEIAHLPDDAFAAGIERDTINVRCQCKDIKALRREFGRKPKVKAAGAEGQGDGSREESTLERQEIAPGPKPNVGPTADGSAKNRITVYLTQTVARENPAQLAALREDIALFAKRYTFIESVKVECFPVDEDAVHELTEPLSSTEATNETNPVASESAPPDWQNEICREPMGKGDQPGHVVDDALPHDHGSAIGQLGWHRVRPGI